MEAAGIEPARDSSGGLRALVITFALLLLLICCVPAAEAGPPPAVQRAVSLVFGRYAGQAMRVVRCETGGTFSVYARNGQYLGLFQMGSWERATYGHGWTPLAQARAAWRYFVASGRDWSPWTCKP